jgi:soluble lytic murein transglycosylase
VITTQTPKLVFPAVIALLLLVPAHAHDTWSLAKADADTPNDVVLSPTPHPRVPADLSRLWFAPESLSRTANALTIAMQQYADGEFTKALPVLSRPASHEGILGPYALYAMADIQLDLGRAAEAREAFRVIQQGRPSGYLAEAAAIGEAEACEALNEWGAAVAIYERLLKGKLSSPDGVLMRLGRAAKGAGQSTKAHEAFVRVYYEYALSPSASDAGAELARINLQAIQPGSERYKFELGRAERLFGARQYGPARTAFEALRSSARGDDRELVDLRIAEANYYLKRRREARDGLRPFLKDGPRKAEALFFHAVVSRELGDVAEYLKVVRQLVNEFPKETWAAEALNNLATHHILRDEDASADAAFRELLATQPRGPYADRAAWRVGWLAYRERRYRDTVTFFERAAADFPRSDYRPGWLYWAGRAREALGEALLAAERFAIVTADYANSYYGRLTMKRPGVSSPAPRVIAGIDATEDEGDGSSVAPPPPNAPLIRALAAAGWYEQTKLEIQYAQRIWNDSPALQATMAWVSFRQGSATNGPDRFALLRGSITQMRRAYPQFMAAGGDQLPREILTTIFPLSYWADIRKYSAAHNLDPYLMAALMAQESTFVADVRSAANAVGLMQLLPSTARRMAPKVGLRYSSRLLTDPQANMRMGMVYFAQLMQEFRAPHLALAGYNAGEGAVRRWLAERPGLPADEFTDDIPYAETQNYVKRIIGTAEDYRRLYSQ